MSIFDSREDRANSRPSRTILSSLIGGPAIFSPDFSIAFADLGSGQVNTTANIAGGTVTGTFTRATTATTINAAGTVISVASGTPRSYYDPTSLAYLGYLAEGARTNLALQSEVFDNASWTKTDIVVTANNTVSPDGLLAGAATGDLMTEGVAGTSLISQTMTATSNANYAFSFWVKRNALMQWLRVFIVNGANSVTKYFDVINGVIGTTAVAGTGAFVSSSITAYPNSWFKITLVGSVGSAATAISAGMSSATADNNATRVNSSTYSLWGAQFEDNVSFASTYIPTTVATVTRNADVLTYPSTSWYNSTGLEGTMYIESMHSNSASANQADAGISDDTLNNRISLFNVVGGLTTAYRVVAATVTTVSAAGPATIIAGTIAKKAIGWATNNFSAYINGVLDLNDITVTPPSTVNNLYVGYGENNTAGTEAFGTIRRLLVYSKRVTDDILQALTR